jgi:hypothetical protein
MKVALFYPSKEAAWSLREGLRNALHRMGHEVTDYGCTGWAKAPLAGHDMIFVSGPEYLWRDLVDVFPSWGSLDIPKVGWLHETVEREDYATNRIAVAGKLPLSDILRVTPRLFTQAHQDQKYGMPWVQCGVDLEMFKPLGFTKRYETVFVGAVYEKRRKFLNQFEPSLEVVRFNRADAPDDDSYVQYINKAHVVLNLPSMSDMSTARVFEVMACGTALITPRTENVGNYDMFLHGEHLMYYEDDPREAMQALKTTDKRAIRLPNRPIVKETLLQRLSRQGREEVVAHHSLESRLKQMLG